MQTIEQPKIKSRKEQQESFADLQAAEEIRKAILARNALFQLRNQPVFANPWKTVAFARGKKNG